MKRKWEQLIEEIKVRDESALFSSNYFWIVNVDFDALQDDVLRHLMSMITAWTKEDEAVEEEVQEHPWNQAIRLRSECVASAKNFAENARVLTLFELSFKYFYGCHVGIRHLSNYLDFGLLVSIFCSCINYLPCFALILKVGIINGPSGQSTSPTPTSSSSDN